MKKRVYLSLLSFLVLFTGCAQTYQNSAPKTDVPQWMSNPQLHHQ